jgi:hypothetical protein
MGFNLPVASRPWLAIFQMKSSLLDLLKSAINLIQPVEQSVDIC